MKSRLATVLTVVLVLVTLAGISTAKREGLWTLTFSHHGFQHILLETREGAVPYYYLPYTVKNETGEALKIRPMGKIVTETGQTLMAAPAPKAAFEICKRLEREMMDIDAMAEKELGAGESREAVFIWKGLDDRADHLDIYLYGLSNEYKYTDEEARTGYLQKVYHMKLFRPGDEVNRHKDKVTVEDEGWIWVPSDAK